MQNDAKMGLVIGVIVVIAIAVVFFRKDAGASASYSSEAAAAAVTAPKSISSTPVQAVNRSAEAQIPAGTNETSAVAGKHHIVKDGDTLFSLAEHYYGDKNRFIRIYQANQAALKTPDALPVGADLVIPDVPDEGHGVKDNSVAEDK